MLSVIHMTEPIGLIVEGGATGADRIAAKWAILHEVPFITYPYLKSLGRRGGPVRNRAMVHASKPDLAVVCPGGAGTAHCTSVLESHGFPIVYLKEE